MSPKKIPVPRPSVSVPERVRVVVKVVRSAASGNVAVSPAKVWTTEPASETDRSLQEIATVVKSVEARVKEQVCSHLSASTQSARATRGWELEELMGSER